jgi:hypothetical protein
MHYGVCPCQLLTEKSWRSRFCTNLNRAFNALLDELDLKKGADGRTRTL